MIKCRYEGMMNRRREEKGRRPWSDEMKLHKEEERSEGRK